MDKRIMGTDSFNIVLVLPIVFYLALLISASVFFIYPYVKSELEVTSVIGFVGMIFVGLPITTYLISTSKDKENSGIIFAVSLTLVSWIISGIFWYIFPSTFNSGIFVPLGMLLMVLSYAPPMWVLYDIYRKSKDKVTRTARISTYCLGGAFTLAITCFVLSNLSDPSKYYNAGIYLLSLIGDVFILSFTIALILTNLPASRWHIYTIIFIPYVFSFIGDSLKMLENLNIVAHSSYAQIFYDAMLISLTVLIFAYMLSRLKLTTTKGK